MPESFIRGELDAKSAANPKLPPNLLVGNMMGNDQFTAQAAIGVVPPPDAFVWSKTQAFL